MTEEQISMSQSERERLKVLQQIEQGHLAQVEGAHRLAVERALGAAIAAARFPGRRWRSEQVKLQNHGILRLTDVFSNVKTARGDKFMLLSGAGT